MATVLWLGHYLTFKVSRLAPRCTTVRSQGCLTNQALPITLDVALATCMAN